MRLNLTGGGWIWVNLLTVKSVEFVPASYASAHELICFTDQTEIEVRLAAGEDTKLLGALDLLLAHKLASHEIYLTDYDLSKLKGDS